MKQFHSSLPLKEGLFVTFQLMFLAFVCCVESSLCMSGLCAVCHLGDVIPFLTPMMSKSLETQIWVRQWVGGALKRQQDSVINWLHKFQGKLKQYAHHILIRNKQAAALQKMKDQLPEGSIIMLTDFAEKYQIRYQDEIGSAHFKKDKSLNVSLYTCVIYFRKDGKLHSQSYGIISDNTKQQTLESQVFNSKILAHIRDKLGIKFQHVHYWSDGASKHFKNKEAMVCLSHHFSLHSCTADWNFTESYHGKGPHDGIGARIKAGVRLRILRRSHIVDCARDVFEVAKSFCDKTQVLYVSDDDIKKDQDKYTKLWTGCKQAHGIQKCRFVTVNGPKNISMFTSHVDNEYVNKPATQL